MRLAQRNIAVAILFGLPQQRYRTSWELFVRYVSKDTPFPYDPLDGGRGTISLTQPTGACTRAAVSTVPSLA